MFRLLLLPLFLFLLPWNSNSQLTISLKNQWICNRKSMNFYEISMNLLTNINLFSHLRCMSSDPLYFCHPFCFVFFFSCHWIPGHKSGFPWKIYEILIENHWISMKYKWICSCNNDLCWFYFNTKSGDVKLNSSWKKKWQQKRGSSVLNWGAIQVTIN